MKTKSIIAQARILNLMEEMTWYEVKLEIFRQLRPMLRAPDVAVTSEAQELSEIELLKLEYDYFFAD